MAKEDESTAAARIPGRWRYRSSHYALYSAAESQLPRLDARADRQLLPHHFEKHPSEELNLTRVDLANH